jgi:DNA-binding transcriptional LysR family regulator
MPNSPAELVNHKIVASVGVTPVMDWKFARDITVMVKPRLTVNSNDAAIETVINGMGITRLLSYQIESYRASGQIQTLLTDFEPPPLPIHVIHREGRYASAKVRAFVDLIVARLRSVRAFS